MPRRLFVIFGIFLGGGSVLVDTPTVTPTVDDPVGPVRVDKVDKRGFLVLKR